MATTEPWRNPRPAPNLGEVRNRVPPQSMLLALLRAWWPALAWSSLIFVASTDAFSADHTSHVIVPAIYWLFPHIGAENVELIHHVIRKCAHFVEYFIFFLFLYRGIRAGRREFHWSWGLIAWAIAALYSLSDEFHQIFVQSRGPSIRDSLLDSTGAFLALLIVFYIYRRRARPTS
jgi:VanZ family protein